MRINQFVSKATGISRRSADSHISSGSITINGQPASLGSSVEPGDQVELDGQPITINETHTYVILNKPEGYVTSRARQGNSKTVYDLLPADFASLRPVGRLDKDSCGLLVLTDDGNFIQTHTHPSFEKQKVYELTLAKPLTKEDVSALTRGIDLSDGPSRVSVLAQSGKQVTVSLSEGRNRQLRRTFGALGNGVVTLKRTKFGSFSLDSLAPGQWEQLDSEAVA